MAARLADGSGGLFQVLGERLSFLENPVLTRIGRISYSLYLWHLVFWPTIYRIVASNIESIPMQYLVAAAGATLLTCACGYASFVALEQGLERYRSHYVIRLLAGEKR